MSEPFTKLYGQRMLQSSVWRQSNPVRIVWMTLLFLKDENGCIFGSAGWLADMARVTDEECAQALRIFHAPDKRSRTSANEGRKIEDVAGGWRVLNHELYRDGMEVQKEKWRRQKAAQREKGQGKKPSRLKPAPVQLPPQAMTPEDEVRLQESMEAAQAVIFSDPAAPNAVEGAGGAA